MDKDTQIASLQAEVEALRNALKGTEALKKVWEDRATDWMDAANTWKAGAEGYREALEEEKELRRAGNHYAGVIMWIGHKWVKRVYAKEIVECGFLFERHALQELAVMCERAIISEGETND